MDPSYSGTPPKPTLPFSMSGDGVEDIEIPSVFMKKGDAESLLVLARQSPEVMVKLSPRTTKGEGEEKEGREKEEGAKEVLRLETASGQTVEEVSQQLQKLLEGLEPELLTDKLKVSVAEELQKLKNLNSGADTANVAEELLKLRARSSGQNDAESADMSSEHCNTELRTFEPGQSGADSAEEVNSGWGDSINMVELKPASCADSAHVEEPYSADSAVGEGRRTGEVPAEVCSARTELSQGSESDGG